MKKSFNLFLVILIGLTVVAPFFAFADKAEINPPKVEVNFFYSETCIHCKAENAFLDKIQPNYPDVKINRYLATDTDHKKLMIDLIKKHNAERYLGAVPLTFVGEDFFPGFDDEAGTGQKITNSIEKQLANPNDGQTDENNGIIKLPI
ncbi:MAG: hypothetical protein NT058_00160, partial [Candidatus Portnoybacteria bacterium]|nr:hypothetical protein [Candidatus Portnoybacteria bacterium]